MPDPDMEMMNNKCPAKQSPMKTACTMHAVFCWLTLFRYGNLTASDVSVILESEITNRHRSIEREETGSLREDTYGKSNMVK